MVYIKVLWKSGDEFGEYYRSSSLKHNKEMPFTLVRKKSLIFQYKFPIDITSEISSKYTL